MLNFSFHGYLSSEQSNKVIRINAAQWLRRCVTNSSVGLIVLMVMTACTEDDASAEPDEIADAVFAEADDDANANDMSESNTQSLNKSASASSSTFNVHRAIDLASMQLPSHDEFNLFEVEASYAAVEEFAARSDELTGLMYQSKLIGEPLAIVGGDYELTQALAKQAVSQLEGTDLDTLLLVYVGAEDQQSEVRDMFDGSGAELRYVVYTAETI